MERQPSMKLGLKSSLEAEPQTLSNKEYQLALAALRAYVNGNIEEETDVLIEQIEAMKAAEGKPPLPKATKDGAGPSTNTSTSTSTETSSSSSSTTGSGSGTGTTGSGSDMKLPALA